MKYEKSCGAVIFDNEKILLIKQIAGHWGFPKGHVEDGETEVQTAIREIKEETNLDVEINDKLRYVETYCPKEDVQKDVVFFIGKKIGGQAVAQEEEVSEMQWVSYEKALEMLTFESSKNVLKKAVSDLKQVLKTNLT